jgi:hypothetical protein
MQIVFLLILARPGQTARWCFLSMAPDDRKTFDRSIRAPERLRSHRLGNAPKSTTAQFTSRSNARTFSSFRREIRFRFPNDSSARF